MEQHDEDRKWSLYLASVSNPFAEQGTFNEFLEKSKTPKKAEPSSSSTKIEIGLNNKELLLQVDNATKILSGFEPPMKGGG